MPGRLFIGYSEEGGPLMVFGDQVPRRYRVIDPRTGLVLCEGTRAFVDRLFRMRAAGRACTSAATRYGGDATMGRRFFPVEDRGGDCGPLRLCPATRCIARQLSGTTQILRRCGCREATCPSSRFAMRSAPNISDRIPPPGLAEVGCRMHSRAPERLKGHALSTTWYQDDGRQ
jgi:hypothetical protein